MRSLLIAVVTLFFSSILFAGGSSVETLKWLEAADPVSDATNALKQKDRRLRAVFGYTLLIPGTDPGKFMEYRKNYGLNPIEGTSDVIENKEHAKLNNLAIEYAKLYNGTILSEVGN